MKELKWDSIFFNLKIGEVFIKDKMKIDYENDFDLIYVKQNEDTELLINGFEKTFQETKIIFSKSITKENLTFEDPIDFDEIPIENEKIHELAYVSGNYSRFLLDPKFGEENFKKLYRTWVDNSVNKKFAKKIFYTIHDHKISGFVTLQTQAEYASVGLIAVDPTFQGQGIGTKLLTNCENYCFLNRIKELRIPTQEENIQACNFYEKIGYSAREKMVIKHYWKKDDH